MLSPDATNITFQIAIDLVNNSSRNIFLTGKAGTGKTTFLKYIKENCVKEVAVVAPTGVAAINAGGTTIHSFFQLPFTPFLPIATSSNNHVLSKHALLSRMRLNKERRDVLMQLELLIIDEISMVRCDTLDAIDAVLRHFRHRNHEPFGGVQVLLIGDMFQLPPVVPREEWSLLSQIYKSPFFFNSKVIEEFPPVFVEFDKIYRQSDPEFIELLNQVRNNSLDKDGLELLQSLFQPRFEPQDNDPYIILTTHNFKADKINEDALAGLEGQLLSFEALVDGDFNEKAYPAEKRLKLKVGAQVMFIKNDADKEKRYFNGKIGVVAEIDGDKIFVQCKGEQKRIEVKKDKWENIRYSLDKGRQKVEEEVVGSFTQYPLRLAWAITIHKSQGLTFEKAVIDAGDAFAPGQAYVALSRCTGLKGLILKSHISQSSLFSDPRIVQFAQLCHTGPQLQEELDRASQAYDRQVLISIFDYSQVINEVAELKRFLAENTTFFNPQATKWLDEVQDKIQTLNGVGMKFTRQLHLFFQKEHLPDESRNLQQRISAAREYFDAQLKEALNHLRQSPAVTDSRQHANEYRDALHSIYLFLAQKQNILESCKEGFSLVTYQECKKTFQPLPFNVNAYAGSTVYKPDASPHPSLYQQLKKLRDTICDKNKLPVYIVAGTKTLDELARYLPQNLDELQKISGFGKAKIESYGQQFVDLIISYCSHHQLSSLITERTPKGQRKETNTAGKTDTKNETFKLYKQGKAISEIAVLRNLVLQTIEGHLAYYVSIGEIPAEELVSTEKLMLMKPVLESEEGVSITAVKQKMGDEISFGEIRLAMAWMEFQKTNAI